MRKQITMVYSKSTKYKDVFVAQEEDAPIGNVYVLKSFGFEITKPLVVTVEQGV